MKKITATILGVLLSLWVLTGCVQVTGGKVYGENDTNIEVKKGGTFVIQLPENPTTGYQWAISIADDAIVKTSDDQYKPDETATDVVGSGGVRVLTFEALEKGTTSVTLSYERSWEEGSAEQTIVYTVTVK